MKRALAMLCATILCVSCLTLAACGGSGSGSAASSGSASASASSTASASASTDYVGDWKFAAMEADMGSGKVTMVGDLDAIASTFGSTNGMQFGLTLNADGTGSFVSSEETYPITWTESATGITINSASTESASAASASAASASAASASAESAASSGADAGLGGIGSTVELTYADGVLSLKMERDGQTGTILFTKDGKLPGAAEITTENAKPITNEADLVGDWKFTGMNMMGMSIYGEADALSSMMGSGDVDTTAKFEAGGKGTINGSEFTYTVGANGAEMESGGSKVPILSLDGSILIDMGSQLGMPLIMVYSK